MSDVLLLKMLFLILIQLVCEIQVIQVRLCSDDWIWIHLIECVVRALGLFSIELVASFAQVCRNPLQKKSGPSIFKGWNENRSIPPPSLEKMVERQGRFLQSEISSLCIC